MMAGLMSGIGRGLSAAGYMGAELFSRQALEEQRSKLEEEKFMRIDEARRQRDGAARLQQGQDITSSVRSSQNERDAAAINAANGSTMTPADAEVLRDKPEARKAYGLMAQTRQSDLEDRGNAAESLGYLDAAKESRGQLQTEIANQRNKDIDASTNKRLDIQQEHNAEMMKFQMRRENRLDGLAASELAFRKARAGKEDARAEEMASREQRTATAKALDGVNADIKILTRDMAEATSPELKTVIQRELDYARGEAKRYRSALAGAGLDGSEDKTAGKAFNPADFPLSGGGKKESASIKTPASTEAPPPATRTNVAPRQPQANEGVDVSNDPVLKSIRESMSQIDGSDPKNVDKVLAYGNAKNARLEQLRRNHGSLTKLTGY
jgi:hypothetical protein